jgi:hypothetical protein
MDKRTYVCSGCGQWYVLGCWIPSPVCSVCHLSLRRVRGDQSFVIPETAIYSDSPQAGAKAIAKAEKWLRRRARRAAKKAAEAEKRRSVQSRLKAAPLGAVISKTARIPVSQNGLAYRRLGFSTYQEYLKSDLWKQIRAKVLLRDGGLCRLCGKPASCVHHQSYVLNVMSGERLDDLYSVCDPCHLLVEFASDGKKRPFKKVTSEFSRRLTLARSDAPGSLRKRSDGKQV